MERCKKCLMPDTRPYIKFVDGVCMPCVNYAKEVDWDERWSQLRSLAKKHGRCAIAVSGGKDSHFQVYVMKELLNMDVTLFSVNFPETTATGRRNLLNMADVFKCEIISLTPNIDELRKRMVSDFREYGSPTRYIDELIYRWPPTMAEALGLELLVYGEDVRYNYSGDVEETPCANQQILNGVVVRVNGIIFPRLEQIYLSYFVKWDSVRNYEIAKRYGFRSLDHEYIREGTLEQYNQIDSISYLLNQWLKYPKYGHASATEMASRWIRAGLKTREEMIPLVKEKDKILDQGIVDRFCEFTRMGVREFYDIVDTWYNPELFEFKNGVWVEKFEVE